MIEKRCEGCGIEFEAKTRRAKYHSSVCGNRHRALLARGGEPRRRGPRVHSEETRERMRLAHLKRRSRSVTGGGFARSDAAQDAYVEEHMAREMAGRCALCSWTMTGTAGEVIAAAARHREAEHACAASSAA